MAFAVKEINENPTILNNITLGFHIYENYWSPAISYKAMQNLLSTKQRFVPNYKCDVQRNLVALIWGMDSDDSLKLATIIDSYKIPQVDSVPNSNGAINTV